MQLNSLILNRDESSGGIAESRREELFRQGPARVSAVSADKPASPRPEGRGSFTLRQRPETLLGIS